jgi:hypothetical protein
MGMVIKKTFGGQQSAKKKKKKSWLMHHSVRISEAESWTPTADNDS